MNSFGAAGHGDGPFGAQNHALADASEHERAQRRALSAAEDNHVRVALLGDVDDLDLRVSVTGLRLDGDPRLLERVDENLSCRRLLDRRFLDRPLVVEHP